MDSYRSFIEHLWRVYKGEGEEVSAELIFEAQTLKKKPNLIIWICVEIVMCSVIDNE